MAQFDYAASTPWEYTPSGMAWPDTFLLATALFAQQGITKGGKPSSFARFLSGRVRLAPATARRARTPHGEGKPSRLLRAVARPTVPGRPSRMSFISPRRARGDWPYPLGARRWMVGAITFYYWESDSRKWHWFCVQLQLFYMHELWVQQQKQRTILVLAIKSEFSDLGFFSLFVFFNSFTTVLITNRPCILWP